MTLPPVALRELQVAARHRSTRAIRLVASLAGTVIVGFGLLTAAVPGNRISGGPLFGFFVVMSAFLVAAAAIFLTSDSLSSEQRNGTLGLMFLTDLTGFDVVLGKLLAAGIGALGALLSAFPFLAVTLVLGGVTGGEFWRSSLALVNLLWVYLVLGLAMSARTANASRALFSAVAWGLLLGVALPIGASLVAELSLPASLARLVSLSPIQALRAARDLAYQKDPSAYWLTLGASHVLGWIFLGIAARKTRALWREDSQSKRFDGASRRVVSRPGIENPIAALYAPTRGERTLSWTVVVLACLVTGMLWDWDLIGFSLPFYGAWPFQPAYFVLKCAFAWKCCRAFHEIREGGGELLLTTPVTELQLLGGPWNGARRWILWPMVTLAFVNIVVAATKVILDRRLDDGAGYRQVLGDLFGTGLTNPLMVIAATATYQFICIGLDFVALAWLSARFGLRSRNAATALAISLGILFVPRWLIFCFPDVLYSAVVLESVRRQVSGRVREWITGIPERPYSPMPAPVNPPILPLPTPPAGR